jgi:2-methylisocitrate lyase-like PEP mutase family enzyme
MIFDGLSAHLAAGVLGPVPLIADGDTGYGPAPSVARTVRAYERAGAAAIQLEDQAFPKRCGHLPGKELITAEAYLGKLGAAHGRGDRQDRARDHRAEAHQYRRGRADAGTRCGRAWQAGLRDRHLPDDRLARRR